MTRKLLFIFLHQPNARVTVRTYKRMIIEFQKQLPYKINDHSHLLR